LYRGVDEWHPEDWTEFRFILREVSTPLNAHRLDKAYRYALNIRKIGYAYEALALEPRQMCPFANVDEERTTSRPHG